MKVRICVKKRKKIRIKKKGNVKEKQTNVKEKKREI